MTFLNYRNTPCQHMYASSPQLLMGRRTRTSLPTTTKLLQPRVVNATKQLEHKKQRMIVTHDSQARDLRPLKKEQDVTVRPTEDETWIRETVTEQCDDRSYKVQVENGVLWRNRIHIREVPSYQRTEAEVSCYHHDGGDLHQTPQAQSLPQPMTTPPMADTCKPGSQPSTSFTPVRPKKATALPKRLNDFIVR